jgi:hypothetical protein
MTQSVWPDATVPHFEITAGLRAVRSEAMEEAAAICTTVEANADFHETEWREAARTCAECIRNLPGAGRAAPKSANPALLEALDECAEELDLARAKLGIVGQGDSPEKRAEGDVDTGILYALDRARTAIAAAKGER